MKVKFKPPLPNRIKKTPWCLKFWKQHFIYYNLFLVPKYKLSKEKTCSCKEAKTVTRSTCHPCGWQGSCKMMNPSKDLHLTPHNLLSKSLRKSLFTLLWSVLHLGKSSLIPVDPKVALCWPCESQAPWKTARWELKTLQWHWSVRITFSIKWQHSNKEDLWEKESIVRLCLHPDNS